MKAPKKVRDLTGIEELRLLVSNANNTGECFNERYTAEQLIAIHRAWQASGWDIYPDEWAAWQVRDALKGIVPEWDNDEKPIKAAK